MDQDERDELLYRLDERTERIDKRLQRVNQDIADNRNDIDVLQDKVSANENTLQLTKRVIIGVGGLLSAVAAKILTGIRIL